MRCGPALCVFLVAAAGFAVAAGCSSRRLVVLTGMQGAGGDQGGIGEGCDGPTGPVYPEATPTGRDGNLTAGAPLFLARGALGLASPARSLAIGDLNGDGKPDLVVAGAGSKSTMTGSVVSVLMNLGDGGFAPRADYPVRAGWGSIALGDLDGNGLPEIVVGGDGGRGIDVLLNGGGGAFEVLTFCECDGFFPTVGLTDIDGDGLSDIVMTTRQGSDSGQAGDLVVVLNDEAHQFTRAPQQYAAGIEPRALALGDVSGDGRADVITAGLCGGRVWLNTGGGSLGDAARHPSLTQEVVLGDVDGDGAADIVGAGRSPWTADLLLNDGHGAFGAPAAVGIRDATRTALGDMNGDGLADLVFATAAPDHKFSVLLRGGAGGPTFDRPLDYARQFPVSFAAIAIADIDGDGKNDVVAVGGSTAVVFINSEPSDLTDADGP